MSEVTLTASTGRETGTRPSRRLRREDLIPGVVYGEGKDATVLSVDRKELRRALSTDAGQNALISLTVDGTTYLTVVKELQRHPVRREVTHIDFLTVDPDGFYNRRVTVVEHTGTHFDAPCHMVDGTARLHEIDPATLARPAAVIDISAEVAGNPDGLLLPEHVHAFEARHGRIPDGAIALVRTGWEEFNTDPARYAGAPGPLRFPGYGADAARILVNDRHAVGLGIDTLGIDSGAAADFPVHRTVSHPRGVWHLEGLQNLASLPPLGAFVFVGVLNLVDGSGSPARVLALVP